MLGAEGVVVAAEDDHSHDQDHDHDMARTAVERGEAAPLGEILKIIAKKFPGEVVDVSLIHSSKIFIYRIKLIAEDNRIFNILVNAGTLQIISVSGP